MKAPMTLISVAFLGLCLSACSDRGGEGAAPAAETPPAAAADQPVETLAPPLDPAAEMAREEIAEGREIAVQNCGGCHALDRDLSSPREDAPPMSTLLSRYDVDALAEDLIEGIKLGHEDMPQFDFSVIGTDSLIAYLKSIRTEPEAASE